MWLNYQQLKRKSKPFKWTEIKDRKSIKAKEAQRKERKESLILCSDKALIYVCLFVCLFCLFCLFVLFKLFVASFLLLLTFAVLLIANSLSALESLRRQYPLSSLSYWSSMSVCLSPRSALPLPVHIHIHTHATDSQRKWENEKMGIGDGNPTTEKWCTR